MIHLDLSKQLAPVDGLAGVVVEGKPGFAAGDSAEKSLSSFKQLLQTGVGRLAMAEGLAGDGAESAGRALRAKFPAGEPADRSTIGAGSAGATAAADGTALQSDAADLESGLKSELAGEKATAASLQEEDAEHTDEQIFEMIWPGLSLRLASRTALRSTDAGKEERSDAGKEERSPPAVFMADPNDAPARPVSLAFGPATFLVGAESVDSVDRSPTPEGAVAALETRIDGDFRATLTAGEEPVVAAETGEPDDFLWPQAIGNPAIVGQANVSPDSAVAAPSQSSPLGFEIPIPESTRTLTSRSAPTAAPSIEVVPARSISETPINPVSRSVEAPPLVEETPAPAGVPSAESPLLPKKTALPTADRVVLESHSVVAKTPIAEAAATRSVMAETLFRPAPVIEPAARLASQSPERVVRLDARGSGQPTTVISVNSTFEEDTESPIDENRITGRERAPFVDASPPRTTHERPSSPPRLAEPFSQTESSGLSSRPTPLLEPRLATAEPTLTAHRAVAASDRPAPPANPDAEPDSTPFATIQSGRQPLTTEAVALAEGSRPQSPAKDSVDARAVGPNAPTAGYPAASPAGPAPAPSARADAGMPPALLPTAPEVLSLLQKNWGWMLGRQLQWMVDNRLHEAKINVNPAQLGPIEVRVSLHQHQTNVMFFSHEAAVREALESALPRLRELLDSQGLHLNQAQVSDQSLARQQSGWGDQTAKQRDGGSAPDKGNRESSADDADEPRSPSRRPQGMVDHYV